MMTSHILLMNALVWGTVLAGDLKLTLTPRLVIDTVTEEFSLECRPSAGLVGTFGLMVDIFRNDVDRDSSFVARQRLVETAVLENNRTQASGQLKASSDDGETFLKVTVLEPTFVDEGVYTCRYIYLDEKFQVQTKAASLNVTVMEVPPPNVEPEVIPPAEVEAGCACDEVMEEIKTLKVTMFAENEKLRKEMQKTSTGGYDGSCSASFSLRYDGPTNQMNGNFHVKFDDVISNNGGAFDIQSGAFSAPCDGQYFFSLSIRNGQILDRGFVNGLVIVNGDVMVKTSVFVVEPMVNFESATNGAVVTLKKGQEVKVEIKEDTYGGVRGSIYAVFTGFFLYP